MSDSAPSPPRDVGPAVVADSHSESSAQAPHSGGGARLFKLSLAALGVVFGDIGTSPLYALRECFHGPHAMAPNPENVLGVLSLIFWSLTLIVSLKYVAYVLRADNQGEGGILALMTLVSAALARPRLRAAVLTLGVFGAALLYGDGVLTPAVSVLSAVEGLTIASPRFAPLVLPLTVAILIGLFAIQRHGTERVGAIFGPIMLLWFAVLSALGVINLIRAPEVLHAVMPQYAVGFLLHHGHEGIALLGAVVLVVTGGEALYADLGHFGRAPIRRAWFWLVFPALILNYLGQGALLIREPSAASNPFFRMMPEWALYPAIALATAATVIASQALISGVFSITRQGTMLGLLPRVTVRHTSPDERGQIYVPTVNWLMMLGTIGLVLSFGSSSEMAAAYGIAVTLTMVITALLFFLLLTASWKWSVPRATLIVSLFFVPELLFLFASAQKIQHGGWFPLLVGALLLGVMLTWKRGRDTLARRFREQMLPLRDFFDILGLERPARVPGTAVFMTSIRDGTPPALLHNFMHNRVVHQHVVLLTIATDDAAHVPNERRLERESLEHGFTRVVARFGFMEQPDVPRLLIDYGVINSSLEGVTFFLGRETMLATRRAGMARWRAHLFAFLSRNSQPATKFFNIPPDRMLEIGTQFEF